MRIENLPKEIRYLALKKQRDAGNIENMYLDLSEAKYEGNFRWDDTGERWTFWNSINQGDFNPYYEKYGGKREFREGDLVICDYPEAYWSKGEIIKLGGRCWKNVDMNKFRQGKEIAAISINKRDGDAYTGCDDIRFKNIRHATPEEVAHYNKVGIGANIKDVGCKLGSIGEEVIVLETRSQASAYGLVPAHGNYKDIVDNAKGCIIDISKDGIHYLIELYNTTNHNGGNIKLIYHKSNIKFLNCKTDEISKKHPGEQRKSSSGTRVSCKKIKAARGSRPIGSRATNLRKRTRAKKAKINGGRLQFNSRR